MSVFYPLLLRVCAKFQANFNLFSFYVVYASGLWVDIEISGVQKSRFVLRKLVGQKKPPKVGHYLESYHSHFPKCTTPCNPKKGVLGGGIFPLQTWAWFQKCPKKSLLRGFHIGRGLVPTPHPKWPFVISGPPDRSPRGGGVIYAWYKKNQVILTLFPLVLKCCP